MWKIRFAIIFAFLALVAIGIRFDDEFNDLDFNIDAEGSGASTPSSGGCEDESSDCASSASECNNTMYKPIMCGLCKKTCNLCPVDGGGDPCAGITPVTLPPSTPAPGDCVDVDSNCESDIAECTNSMYIPLMCKYCRKTCCFCDNCTSGNLCPQTFYLYKSSYAEDKFALTYGHPIN